MEKYEFKYNGQINLVDTPGIYAIVNTLNGKKYIGSTHNLKKRYRQHFNELRQNIHVNIHLQRAFNKYGRDKFEFWILEHCDDVLDTLLMLEQKYIDSDGDYNICKVAGSTTGITYTGHPISEAHRKIVAEANRRRVWTKESRRKLAESIRNTEYNAKLRKAIVQMDLNGEVVKEYDSIMAAANAMGFENKRVCIKRCCQGKQKTAYGFKWKFKNGNETNIVKDSNRENNCGS